MWYGRLQRAFESSESYKWLAEAVRIGYSGLGSCDWMGYTQLWRAEGPCSRCLTRVLKDFGSLTVLLCKDNPVEALACCLPLKLIQRMLSEVSRNIALVSFLDT